MPDQGHTERNPLSGVVLSGKHDVTRFTCLLITSNSSFANPKSYSAKCITPDTNAPTDSNRNLECVLDLIPYLP